MTRRQHVPGTGIGRRGFVGTVGLAALGALGLPGVAAAQPWRQLLTTGVETSGPIVGRLRPEHPRLIATMADFAAAKQRAQSDPYSQQWYAKLRADGQRIRTEPPSKYEKPDGIRLLDTSRRVLSRVDTLALLYRLDGDAGHAERAWQELAAAAAFPDWNPSHFLDTAEMTHAFAIGYDWLYDYWSPQRRQVIRDAIVAKGLTPALPLYRGGLSWVKSRDNWNIVCNAGLGMGALAIGDEAVDLAEEILASGLDSLPPALGGYGPDGAFPEGVVYWAYATKYAVAYLAGLRTAVGTDFDLSRTPGLSETGLFPIQLTGPSGLNVNYYDADTATQQPAELFWLANAYSKPLYTWWGRLSGATPRHLLWYRPDNHATPEQAGTPRDAYFRHSEIAAFRSAWSDPRATYAVLKAGNNQTGHADLDLGTFVLDALDARWAVELGPENYNLPGYWDQGPTGQRWSYYRKRAEGQNTLVVNPGAGPDQDPLARATIVRHAAGQTEAFAVADLTAAYKTDVSSWQRGVTLLDNRRRALVQDEVRAGEPAEVWWFMHTRAAIEMGAGGRSATLTLGDNRLVAELLSPAQARFVVMDAKPLWTSPDPQGQDPNHGVRKLAVHCAAQTNLRLAVVLTPLRSWETGPGDPPAVTPLSDWTVDTATAPRLRGLTIDGKPLATFSPDTFTYDVDLPGGARPPTIGTDRAPGTAVQTDQCRRVPGTAAITVRGGRGELASYQVHFHLPPKPDGRIAVAAVAASANDGNGPENTLDGKLTTRWSAEGDGQWIRYDLGSPKTVRSVSIAWWLGDVRSSTFDIETSDDAATWTAVHRGSSSGRTSDLENYPIGPVTARYVRVVGHGNSANVWNSIAEVGIFDRVVEPPVEPLALREVSLAAAPAAVLRPGETTQLSLSGTMSDGTAADLSGVPIRYVSATPAVARVTDAGLVTAVAEGTARLSGIVTTKKRLLKYDSITVEVDDPRDVKLRPTADAYVQDGPQAGTNYGASTALLVKKSGSPGFTRESYLAFDLSKLAGPVQSAELYLYAVTTDTAGTEIDVFAHPVTADWTESAVTWNNRPTTGPGLGDVRVDSVAAWRTIDLTAYVQQQAAAGGSANIAIRQAPPSGWGLTVQIRSRENTGYSPYLKIRLDSA